MPMARQSADNSHDTGLKIEVLGPCPSIGHPPLAECLFIADGGLCRSACHTLRAPPA